MTKFCAICGRKEQEVDFFVENFCSECYKGLYLNFHVPDVITIHTCAECGAIKKGRSWEKGGEAQLLKAIEATVRKSAKIPRSASIRVRAVNSHEALVDVSMVKGGHEITNGFKVKLVTVNGFCHECSKVARGQYSAVVQLRIKGERHVLEEALTLFYKKYMANKGRAQIVKVEGVRGGVDVKFASPQAAKFFANLLKNHFGADIKESYKLIGIDRSTGRQKHRLTISARIP